MLYFLVRFLQTMLVLWKFQVTGLSTHGDISLRLEKDVRCFATEVFVSSGCLYYTEDDGPERKDSLLGLEADLTK